MITFPLCFVLLKNIQRCFENITRNNKKCSKQTNYKTIHSEQKTTIMSNSTSTINETNKFLNSNSNLEPIPKNSFKTHNYKTIHYYFGVFIKNSGYKYLLLLVLFTYNQFLTFLEVFVQNHHIFFQTVSQKLLNDR